MGCENHDGAFLINCGTIQGEMFQYQVDLNRKQKVDVITGIVTEECLSLKGYMPRSTQPDQIYGHIRTAITLNDQQVLTTTEHNTIDLFTRSADQQTSKI